MEENLQPAWPDLAAAGISGDDLTRSNSDSSALTCDSSKHTFDHNLNSTPSQCMRWTDEKHKLYLDSLEASFVDQLHQSKGLLAYHSDLDMEDPNLSRKLRRYTHISSHQFVVRQDGCWQKINFERSQALLDTSPDCRIIVGGPWVDHFRSAGKGHTIASDDLQQCRTLTRKIVPVKGKRTHGPAACLEQLLVCRHSYYQDSVGSLTEVSDQNFVDEDHEEKSSISSSRKRLKLDDADPSSTEQILPHGKFHKTETSTVCDGSPERTSS